jgi:preprotein translocase subunit SecD
MPPALQNPFVLWFVLTAALAAAAYFGVRRELRVRATLYGAFILACIVAMWPPRDRIHLGLDLKGGIHLVLQVVTDEALSAITGDQVQAAREQANKKGIVFSTIQLADPQSFTVEGVEPARVKDMRDLLKDFFRLGWEIREPGEGRFLVKMTEGYGRQMREQTVREVMRTLERRVNQLGVAEPIIAIHGEKGDQILIQLPGLTDVESAKKVIQTTAQLHLKLVEDQAGSQEALLQKSGGQVPEGKEVVQGQGDTPGQPIFYLVGRESVITGRDLKNARVSVDENNQPAVSFSLNTAGASKFKQATGANVGRQLAIVLDNAVESAPVIRSQISDEGQISGRFTTEEADILAKVLRAGALPATLKPLQELTVGPSLGRDSVRAGVTASVAGMAFLGVFMLVYYRLSGVNAVVALVANVVILMGAMAYTGATLTLPGIAGVILTIGVGVDTNVLVFERIREELRNGKTVRAAVQNGFERVWITILDTHATALIAAAFLFQFGTGPIKGFAVTLVMGLIANVFASYFVSKFLFEWILGKGQATTQQQFSI